MYKIVLVDDEPLFRRALYALVNWEEYGFTVVYEAVNGQDALEYINNNTVDIIITDIRMPVMDGLELLKKVSVSGLDISTVMLSSYDDFHLVRDSFKLGACDYILKTDLDPETVIVTLKKLSEILEMRNQIKDIPTAPSEKTSSQKQNALEKITLRDKFFKELIWGSSYNSKNIEDYLHSLEIKLTPKGLILVVLCVDNFIQTASSSVWEDKRELLSFAILNILEEKLSELNKGNVFSSNQSEFVMLFNFDNKTEYNHYLTELGSFFEDLRKCLEAYLHIHISAGVSNMEDGYNKLHLLYSQASNALKYGSVLGKGRFIVHSFYHNLGSNSQDLGDFISEAPLVLQNALDSLEPQKIKDTISKVCIQGRYIPLEFIEDIYKLYDRYEFIISSFAYRNNLQDMTNSLLNDFKKLRMTMTASLREYDIWIRHSLEVISLELVKGQDIIGKTKKYIQCHYNKDISLESAADELGISPSHLSRVFVKETGVNFVDYLTDIRISHAKEYLQNTNLKLYEIAELVGFNSVEYFSKVFKKKEGRSPKRSNRM